VELPHRLIQLYTYENEVVLDPFMGSGQTAIAALNDNRPYVGYEIESQYVRLAEKRGVVVRPGTGVADFDRLYALYAETSVRNGFVIRPRDYYIRAWGGFIGSGLAQPFLAEIAGEAVAGLIAYRFGRRAWYLYGMSSSAHRESMPNHALQWAAIRWARDAGCTTYDFWGAPEELDPADPLWGVYRFKEGFGARHVRLAGSWDYSARPAAYRLYTVLLPRLLGWTRRRQQDRTRRLLDPAA
jgi:lipid II:glycine glycyltransferase (peptidoglycan interpeptide bridge formation enzyme)